MSRFPSECPFDAARREGRRGPNGRPICRWCGEEVPPRRSGWCSMRCVDEWRLTSDPAVQRRAVFERDQGICQGCDLDLSALAALLRANGTPKRVPAQARNARMGARPESSWSVSGIWDMDHIVPVHHGGGACGIENLQTLCIWCHKEKTAQQARTRASRDATKQPASLVNKQLH